MRTFCCFISHLFVYGNAVKFKTFSHDEPLIEKYKSDICITYKEHYLT